MDLETLRTKKVGVALGVGGVRGAAHFGVVRTLFEHGVNVSCVSGSSSGAVFGAICASGMMDRAEEFFRQMTWWDVVKMFWEIPFPRGGGLFPGKKLEKWLRQIIPYNRFEELPIPLAVIAADLFAGTEVVIQKGDLFTALRASCAVPCYFRPVLYNGRWMVDGGLMNSLPVTVCRQMGADVVIGVDVNLGRSYRTMKPPLASPSFMQVFVRTCKMIENAWTRHTLQKDPPDILIQPPVGHVMSAQIRQINHAIKAGEIAARHMLNNLGKSEC